VQQILAFLLILLAYILIAILIVILIANYKLTIRFLLGKKLKLKSFYKT